MLRFRSLGSGSSGNATVIEARGQVRTTRMLVDCGFTLRELDRRLARAGLAASDIDAVFITHEHGDHFGSVHAFSLRGELPVWMSEGTWRASGTHDFEGRLRLTRDGDTVEIGELMLQPFTVPHDAREPLQLICSDGARRMGVLTDLGHATPHALAHVTALDALLLEFNHDPQMLANSRYPAFLKRRVSSPYGHLANEAAAAIAEAVCHDKLRHLVATHLSQRNNRPELVRRAMAQAVNGRDQDMLCADAVEGCPWLGL